MKIDNFNYFKIGSIFNPLPLNAEPQMIAKKITIQYPTRLNAMAIDPSKITENNNMIYTPGEVVFSTKLFLEVSVELIEEETVVIDNVFVNKDSVIRHACLIMKEAVHYPGGFRVRVSNYHDYRHCGLGSTGSLQAAIGACINHMFNSPFEPDQLVKYLARNYGEEIDGNDTLLNPVQCIGGSAASGLFAGGVLVLAGENVVIAEGVIPENYRVLIGIPRDFTPPDSVAQFDDEKDNLDKFAETGALHRNQIAYNILHAFLPALKEKKIARMGDVIFDYRYNMGSIKNCSYTYPALTSLMDKLAFLKRENHVDVLSISSVGPAIFAIVEEGKAEFCKTVFADEGLDIIETSINNQSYIVTALEAI